MLSHAAACELLQSQYAMYIDYLQLIVVAQDVFWNAIATPEGSVFQQLAYGEKNVRTIVNGSGASSSPCVRERSTRVTSPCAGRPFLRRTHTFSNPDRGRLQA
jgi:hypothetical protein